jgi:N-acetylglucosamine-6-sulfatase
MINKLNRRSFLSSVGFILSASPLLRYFGRQMKISNTLPQLRMKQNVKQRNIIFILSDDHRFDAMGCAGHPFVNTPNMDYLAENGVHVKNAYVTTSLCSPSRASILTGQYAHKHGIVDNQRNVPDGTIFFPQYLQQVGYETAFIGKWHMGSASDEPRPGFDHWISFKGQGSYWPNEDGLNVNGKKVAQKGYITDELTDYAIDWLNNRSSDKPFMMYLSHKAVHSHHEVLKEDENGIPQIYSAEIIPAERHKGNYKDKPFILPQSMVDTAESRKNKPMWVTNQRNSWHGMDFPWHNEMNMGDYYRQYMESLRSVDDSIGRVLEFLRNKKMLESTLVIYMGDNGFLFGEHGLIDKRNAYEASMRVPMLVHCPDLIPKGIKVNQVIANIDIAPTLLDVAGLETPKYMDGQSFLPLLRGEKIEWRDYLLYEYYWERNYPHTPTVHALRGDRFKYIHYYGLWDTDELYDMHNDPDEMKNLIDDPQYNAVVDEMNKRLFDILEETGGMQIPLRRDSGHQRNLRKTSGSKQAKFQEKYLRKHNGIE